MLFSVKICYMGRFLYLDKRKKNRWMILNLPISQKSVVVQAIWPFVAPGKKRGFLETSLAFIGRLKFLTFLLILPECYQRIRKITSTYFCAVQKINELITFSRQAWWPVVTDIGYFSVLNLYQYLINFKGLIVHYLRYIYIIKKVHCMN